MLRTYFLIMTMMTHTLCSVFEAKPMDSVIDGESDCVGSLKLVTTDRTHIVRISESRLNIKNVKQVVVEGSCCGSIYFKKNFRGRSTSWDRAGLIKTSLWRVKSVRLRGCTG